MYNYQSDTTQFLNEFIEQHPEEAEQRLPFVVGRRTQCR